MNHTTASCGHSVIAAGAPGSDARKAQESQPCGNPHCCIQKHMIIEVHVDGKLQQFEADEATEYPDGDLFLSKNGIITEYFPKTRWIYWNMLRDPVTGNPLPPRKPK